jgi:hypothetical protein
MQAGVRDWARRAAQEGGRRVRSSSPTVLVSLLCASAVSPVVAAGTGMTEAVAVAGVGLVSSVGGNVLSGVITDALDRLRERAGKDGPSPDQVEAGIAGQIQEALDGGGEDARALRAEIAALLELIDAGGTALRGAIEDGSEQVRQDVIAVFGELGAGFAELRFLLGEVERAAGQIQDAQDAHGAQLRTLADRVGWAGTEARLAREAAVAWQVRPGGDAVPVPRWADGSPYRGLLPFTESEAEVFYGRERLTADLAGMISRQLGEAGLVIVTGVSGAGKSSLLRAGLLPALARGRQLPGSQDWPRIVMSPGARPLAELAAHLAAVGRASAADILNGLSADPASARLAVRQAVLADARSAGGPGGGRGARLMLVVDQFEQVFAPERVQVPAGSVQGLKGPPDELPVAAPGVTLQGVRGQARRFRLAHARPPSPAWCPVPGLAVPPACAWWIAASCSLSASSRAARPSTTLSTARVMKSCASLLRPLSWSGRVAPQPALTLAPGGRPGRAGRAGRASRSRCGPGGRTGGPGACRRPGPRRRSSGPGPRARG